MSAIAALSTGRVRAETAIRLSRLQRDMAVAQVEMASGRRALSTTDRMAVVPAHLMLRSRIASLETSSETYRVARGVIAPAQSSLAALQDLVTSVQTETIAAAKAASPRQTMEQTATGALRTLSDITGTSFNGRYIFGGIKGDLLPMGDISAPSMRAGLQQFAAAFSTAFGVPAGDPGTTAVTAAQMTAYVHAQVSQGTSTATWQSVWSQASEMPSIVQVESSSSVATSVTTDEIAFRHITLGLALLATSGLDALSDEAATVVVDTARGLLNDGLIGLTALSARLADSDQALADHIDQNDAERRSLASAIAALEAVDPGEVAVRASDLLRGMEAAYTALGRLARLSLLDQLR